MPATDADTVYCRACRVPYPATVSCPHCGDWTDAFAFVPDPFDY